MSLPWEAVVVKGLPDLPVGLVLGLGVFFYLKKQKDKEIRQWRKQG
jgi:hypothetical protein